MGHLRILLGLLLCACGAPQAPAGTTPGPAAEVPVAGPGAASGAGHLPSSAPGDEVSILNLYDAFGEPVAGTQQDFGFSALVRYRGITILFDAGTNAEVLKRNAAALGVDLREVDFAVASHSHFDHISGFDYLLEVNPEVKIYFPNDPFWGAPLPFDATGPEASAAEGLPPEQRYFGGEKTKFTFDSSGRFWKANVEFVKESRTLMPGVRLVATRSPYMGYFSKYPNTGIGGEADHSEIKTVPLPELSLSLSTGEGQVLIVGCSHSRVDVITEAARDFVDEGIALVMGGYHLLPYEEDEVRGIAERLQQLGVQRVAPAHCTGHLGFKIFRELYGDRYLLAGLGSKLAIEPLAVAGGPTR